MARSLNKVMLIGNLTRDPELRYTPNGAAVCTIGLATNRYWTTESGERREETEFHRIVAWNKLAELCSQLLTKGRKVYVEGRLRTATWQQPDGTQRSSTEVVADEVILLDSKRPVVAAEEEGVDAPPSDTQPQQVSIGKPAPQGAGVSATDQPVKGKTKADQSMKDQEEKETPDESPGDLPEDVSPDDIPF